ncbi:MAG: flavodoxin [Spirochaetaceae bacterium]|nr:MAG: flavodoxin [Spirochaetaceae bacterium]
MANIGIFYGSSTGNTRDVSEKLQNAFGVDNADLHNIADTDIETLTRYNNLIFAVSTWGAGDLQDDWEDFFPNLDTIDFTGKKVAVMCLGDQENYPDFFADAMVILTEKVAELGGTVVGETSIDGYSFDVSKSARNGKFAGLVIDEDSQSDKTDQRIGKWVERLRSAFK